VGDAGIQRHPFPRLQINRELVAANRVLVGDNDETEQPQASAAYRILRARIMHKMAGNNWSSLGFTSPGPGDGKSLTTLNLALSLARGRTGDVILLDLDLRSPSICHYLGVTPPHDLTSYFAGACGPNDVLFTVGVENLVIAGSSVPIEHASDLIASGRFEELLASIANMSSDPVVLLDLPPLLVTDEALLVAPRVDAIALIVSEGVTRRDLLERVKQMLEDFTFAGVVLNRSSETFGADSYYGYRYRETKS
jgi:Mrp family chromosome partitioning ATPase